MTPEGRIKKKVKDLLDHYGAWHYWPVSNGMGVHGIPDCLICYRGRFASVETKAPGRKPTALQEVQGHKIRLARGLWFIIDGPEGLTLLEEWLECTK